MGRKKCFGLGKKNPWNSFLGDCSVIDEYMKDKPISIKWFFLHYINVFLRAVGQPAFVNNPIAGLIILIGLFLPDWRIGLGCLIGGSISTLTELILQIHPWQMMRNGVAPVNGVLVGTVFSALFPVVFCTERTTELWVFIVLGAFSSQFICSAFNNILSAFKVPYMAWPFNVIATLCFITLHSFHTEHDNEDTVGKEDIALNASSTNLSDTIEGSHLDSKLIICPVALDGPIDWGLVGKGIALSMGQVYGINHLEGSIVINMGVFVASPLNFITSTIGATLGTLMGVAFLSTSALDGTGNFQEVYDGVWGYNSLLAMSSVSCVFFAFTGGSFLLSVVNVGATGVAQYALRSTMQVQSKIPVFTMPKNLCTLMMLAATDSKGRLHRMIPGDMSYPEKQSYEVYKKGEIVPTEDVEPSVKEVA